MDCAYILNGAFNQEKNKKNRKDSFTSVNCYRKRSYSYDV